MLGVTCKYVSSSGENIDLLSFPYFISDMAPFFNYSHSILTSYGRIVGFANEETTSREIVINVASERLTEREFLEAKEELFAIFEHDISVKSPGTMWVNGYGLKCYVVSENVNARFDVASQSTFSVVSDQRSKWTKDLETLHVISGPTGPIVVPIEEGDIQGGGNVEPVVHIFTAVEEKTYPYGYNYGYPFPYSTVLVTNPIDRPVNFRLKLDGPWENPGIFVGGNYYGITQSLAEGESVIINGQDKTVKKDGDNWFQYLDKQANPFGMIQPRDSLIRISNVNASTYEFWLVLVDERVCPAWI